MVEKIRKTNKNGGVKGRHWKLSEKTKNQMIKQIYNKIKEMWIWIVILCLIGFVCCLVIVDLRADGKLNIYMVGDEEISIKSETKIMIQQALFDFQREQNYLTRDEIVNTVMDLYHDIGTGESVKTLIMEVGEMGPRGFKGEKGDIGKGEKGDTGLQGIKGDRGLQGDQGIQGLKGDKGDMGKEGDTGD